MEMERQFPSLGVWVHSPAKEEHGRAVLEHSVSVLHRDLLAFLGCTELLMKYACLPLDIYIFLNLKTKAWKPNSSEEKANPLIFSASDQSFSALLSLIRMQKEDLVGFFYLPN